MSLLLHALLGANVDASGSSFQADGRTSRDQGINFSMVGMNWEGRQTNDGAGVKLNGCWETSKPFYWTRCSREVEWNEKIGSSWEPEIGFLYILYRGPFKFR